MSDQREFYEGDQVVLLDGREGQVFHGNLKEGDEVQRVVTMYGFGALTAPSVGDVGIIVARTTDADVIARQANRDGTAFVLFVSPQRLTVKKPGIRRIIADKTDRELGDVARALAADLVRVAEVLQEKGYMPTCYENFSDFRRLLQGLQFKKTTIDLV